MTWAVLVFSGLMEAVWATALGRFDGLSNVPAIIAFVLGLTLSMCGLGYAVRTLPTGTAYAVWVGIGAAATVTYAMITGAESASIAKIVLIIVLVACVIGLKLVGDAV